MHLELLKIEADGVPARYSDIDLISARTFQ